MWWPLGRAPELSGTAHPLPLLPHPSLRLANVRVAEALWGLHIGWWGTPACGKGATFGYLHSTACLSLTPDVPLGTSHCVPKLFSLESLHSLRGTLAEWTQEEICILLSLPAGSAPRVRFMCGNQDLQSAGTPGSGCRARPAEA